MKNVLRLYDCAMKKNILTATIIITLSIVFVVNPAVEQGQTDPSCHSCENRLPNTKLMSEGVDINKYPIPEDKPLFGSYYPGLLNEKCL